MTKKQKKQLYRIIIALCMMVFCFVMANTFLTNEIAVIAILLAAYGVVGSSVLLRAASNIRRGQIFDENFLMAIATVGAICLGEYLEAIAVMLFYQTGELFESIAVNRSRKSIAGLMEIRPDHANVLEDGVWVEVDPESVSVGDEILIKPGERAPLDGTVVSGESAMDTSAVTGEPLPRDVVSGSQVYSGCINLTGTLIVKVDREYSQSTVARILELVENASDKKAEMESFITRFARYYTPTVVFSALCIAFLPPILIDGAVFHDWVYRALTFLVISCPCALVISIPLSFFGGMGGASKMGILVKGGNYLEALAQAEVVVFDKTGTLTKGSYAVTDICVAGEQERERAKEQAKEQERAKAQALEQAQTLEQEQAKEQAQELHTGGQGWSREQFLLLELAALAESYSDHPVSLSLRKAYSKAADLSRVGKVVETPGFGVEAEIDGETVYVGNRRLLEESAGIRLADYAVDFVAGSSEGEALGTAVYVAKQGVYLGHILISDEIKETAAAAISSLKAVGIKQTVMLTGDTQSAGQQISAQLGIDQVYAGLLPEGKVDIVERLLSTKSGKGKLAFVGDGINDAPALARADVGVAMGALGTEAAIEAADVVIMDDDPARLVAAIRNARKTLAIARQNTVFSLGVKGLVLVLGAMGYASMWAAVFADVGVMVIAILNALRALRV